MEYFTTYTTLIFVIKIVFILTALSHFYLKAKGEENSELDKTILFWKERLEFVFVFLMAILLIYLFNPRTNNIRMINEEVKLLLYLFGFALLITAKWNTFLTESTIFIKLQKSIGY